MSYLLHHVLGGQETGPVSAVRSQDTDGGRESGGGEEGEEGRLLRSQPVYSPPVTGVCSLHENSSSCEFTDALSWVYRCMAVYICIGFNQVI